MEPNGENENDALAGARDVTSSTSSLAKGNRPLPPRADDPPGPWAVVFQCDTVDELREWFKNNNNSTKTAQ